MTPPSPSSFLGGGSYRPEPTKPAIVSLPRCVATLTVYEDGFINLNQEASVLLAGLGQGVCLHPPAPTRAGRTPQPWQLSAGTCCVFSKRTDKYQLRFRAAHHPPAGRYLLSPVAGNPARFVLVQA